MDHLIWSPVPQVVLISRSHWEFSLFLGHIGTFDLLWFHFVTLIGKLILRSFLHAMRIDDFVLLFNIERLELCASSHSLDSVVASVFSLIVGMNTSWVSVTNGSINHLPSTGSSHEVLVVLNKILTSFRISEFKTRSSFGIIIIILVLDHLLRKINRVILVPTLSVRVFPHHLFLFFIHYHTRFPFVIATVSCNEMIILNL